MFSSYCDKYFPILPSAVRERVTVYRSADRSAASGSNLCPVQLHVKIYVVLLLLQEKGIPLMGESSFLASWVNRRAMMMGMCVFFKIVLLFGSLPASSFVKPTTQGKFLLPEKCLLWHLCLTVNPCVMYFKVSGILHVPTLQVLKHYKSN